MLEWLNLISLIISIFLFCYFYTLSLQPKKREREKGEKAWKQCAQFRYIAGAFEFIILINIILWVWFPISILDWTIHPNYWVGIAIFIMIAVPGTVIMVKGMIDAGSETMRPSVDTEIYGGIYNYIRHPQSLGEFPIFVALGFFVNSWFLVLILTTFVIIYVPIMIHYEEKDLIKRFGESYEKYRKRTGALLPKIRK
jgi:protein-S-isoprenylcysteine O-methyltransferase Ste14